MSARRAFFRNQLPTSVDEDQNTAVAALVARVASVEGRAGALESDVATRALQSALAAEVSARITGIFNQEHLLEQEVLSRQIALNNLASQVETSIGAEVAARNDAIEARATLLLGDISNVESALADEVVARDAAIAIAVLAEGSARATALAAEAAARAAAITTVEGVVAQQASDTAAALNLKASLVELGAEVTAREAAIADEINARAAAISSVEDNASQLAAALAAESSLRAIAIDGEAAARSAAIAAEAAARETAIAAEAAARNSALLLKSDKTYVDAQFQTKADASSRVTAENSFLTAFKDAIFLEGAAGTDVEFNYTTLMGSAPVNGGGGSLPITVVGALFGSGDVKIAYTSTQAVIAYFRDMTSGVNVGPQFNAVVTSTPIVATLSGVFPRQLTYGLATSTGTLLSGTFAPNATTGQFGDQSAFGSVVVPPTEPSGPAVTILGHTNNGALVKILYTSTTAYGTVLLRNMNTGGFVGAPIAIQQTSTATVLTWSVSASTATYALALPNNTVVSNTFSGVSGGDISQF